MSDSEYLTSDGEPCTLPTLCRLEPSWAASRIKELGAALAECRAELEKALEFDEQGLFDAYLELQSDNGRLIREKGLAVKRAEKADARLAAVLAECEAIAERARADKEHRHSPKWRVDEAIGATDAVERIRSAATCGEGD